MRSTGQDYNEDDSKRLESNIQVRLRGRVLKYVLVRPDMSYSIFGEDESNFQNPLGLISSFDPNEFPDLNPLHSLIRTNIQYARLKARLLSLDKDTNYLFNLPVIVNFTKPPQDASLVNINDRNFENSYFNIINSIVNTNWPTNNATQIINYQVNPPLIGVDSPAPLLSAVLPSPSLTYPVPVSTPLLSPPHDLQSPDSALFPSLPGLQNIQSQLPGFNTFNTDSYLTWSTQS